jgi:hypothetical protein
VAPADSSILNNGSTPSIEYSLIENSGGSGGGWDGGVGTDGGNNLDADPLFVNLVGGDLHLSPGSPAIDAGHPAILVPLTDLDGNPRVSGLAVDMGAYEYTNVTGVWDPKPGVPPITRLLNAYPNPFLGATTIRYELAGSSPVRIEVFDLEGRLIKLAENSEEKDPGKHEALWDGRDKSGLRVPAGVYFYRLVTSTTAATRKLVLIR